SFYSGYDPVCTWWTADLHKEVDQALQDYATLLRDKAAGVTLDVQALPRPSQFTASDASNPRPAFPTPASDAPDLAKLLAADRSEMGDLLARYQADRSSLGRLGTLPGSKGPKSAEGQARLKKFCEGWLAALDKLAFDKLSQDGRVDYLLLTKAIRPDLNRPA